MITTHAAGGWGLNQPPDRQRAGAAAVELVGRVGEGVACGEGRSSLTLSPHLSGLR